jgi:hypothetical protein
MLPRVYADFHNLDDENRIRLTSVGTQRDLRKLGIDLKDGLALTFYMDDADDQGNPDDIMVDGVVHGAGKKNAWVAVVDWETVYHASDIKCQASANGGIPKRDAN